jgi:hypothetical protein
VLPLHSSMVLPLGTSRSFRSAACLIRIIMSSTAPPLFERRAVSV